MKKTPSFGKSIVCIDDIHSKSLLRNSKFKNFLSYGFDKKSNFHINNVKKNKNYTTFDLTVNISGSKIYKIKKIKINLFGDHNIRNVTAAITVAVNLGIKQNKIKKALKKFMGIQRRFTKVFSFEKKEFFDDYAHHPTEIKAVIKGAREVYKERKIISDHLKEWKSNVVYYEIDTPTISEFMTDEEINSLSGIFFIPSNDPVFVSDIISRLHALKDGSIVVFCSDDILDFSLIPHSELYDLNVRFFSESKPFFDKSDFIKSFYEYFSIHPQNKYVYQGYKCGLYFLNNFFGNLISSEKSLFGTYYNFVLKENNIYRNEAFKLWKYEKHSIVEMLETNENQ